MKFPGHKKSSSDIALLAQTKKGPMGSSGSLGSLMMLRDNKVRDAPLEPMDIIEYTESKIEMKLKCKNADF